MNTCQSCFTDSVRVIDGHRRCTNPTCDRFEVRA